jgi:predicted DCC family thiol-disulfide oxidoreductase YuxK
MDQQMLAMAHLYGWSCTQQEEKYTSFVQRGYTWRWEDMAAAFALWRELPDRWALMDAYKALHVCRTCGFPKTAHAGRCREVA